MGRKLIISVITVLLLGLVGSASADTFTNSIGMEFVRIDPGTFTMGSGDGDPDEEPVHQVTISNSFWAGLWSPSSRAAPAF
jgi:formylglycine-generating enzyme required for sulfatase activity